MNEPLPKIPMNVHGGVFTGLDDVDLREFEVDTDAARIVSRSVAARSRAVPIAFAPDGALIVAVQGTFDTLALPRLETMTGREVRPLAASATAIMHLIGQLPDEPGDQRSAEEVPRIKSQRELQVPSADPSGSSYSFRWIWGRGAWSRARQGMSRLRTPRARDEEGDRESLLARDLRKTKEDVVKLEEKLREAVAAAQETIAANEKLNSIRGGTGAKDSED